MRVFIARDGCISCGACIVICPFSAIHFVDGRAAIDSSRCTQCQKCVCKCYTRAIRTEDVRTAAQA